jgi:copper homeostasis protein
MHSVEICAYSLASCLAAQRGGAQRVELCGGFYEGGTTPSAGLITLARKALNIKLYVMIRPRGGDFCYDTNEIETMLQDIYIAKQLGTDGVVLGVLKPDGQVNQEQTRQLVMAAAPMGVTFHRAFDVAASPTDALESIHEAGCERILTSGQRSFAHEGIELLASLALQAKKRIEIMAGSGVNEHNALALLQAGVDALHLSGKISLDSPMKFRKEGISMGGVPGLSEYEIVVTDYQKVQKVVEIAQNFSVTTQL